MKATIVLLLAFASFGTLAQTVDICDRTPEVRQAIIDAIGTDYHCHAVDPESLAHIGTLNLQSKQLTALRAGDFADLDGLERLWLRDNRLTTLPDGAFDGLDNLKELLLQNNRLTTLPGGAFDDLGSLETLALYDNRLTTLPDGVFDGLGSLESLYLNENKLTSLPDGAFDGLGNLEVLYLHDNRLTTLPDGVFDGLGSLGVLLLLGNQLETLPDGAFDALDSLYWLDLRDNHLVELTRDDPLFECLDIRTIRLSGQIHTSPSPPSRIVGAVPLMLSASHYGKQGFVRIVNESDKFGIVRVFAVDDGGNAPDTIEFRLGARQDFHFNSDDLENGNPAKGIEHGVGYAVQGDWRLDIETTLPVRVMSFVRHGDGFLTAMHDVLPRTDDGRLVAYTFNPGRNTDRASSLRLVNTGENDANVSIEGVDSKGNTAGPVTLTLPAGESRTFSAFDLENGTHGLSGTLGTGAGKWRLFVTANRSVVGMALLQSASGHLTNISTSGVAPGG